MTLNDDVQLQPLHQPSTRRDHRKVSTAVTILRTWSHRSSDSTNMVPRQGSQRHEPCPSGQFLHNKAASNARLVASPIKQLPTVAPTTPTTWSESQLHRQVHFQTASSPTKIYRPARYSFRNTSPSRWSQDRSLHGFGCRRPTIPIKKESINSATWQTPQIESGDRLGERLQPPTCHLLAVEDRLHMTLHNDVQLQPLHQPST